MVNRHNKSYGIVLFEMCLKRKSSFKDIFCDFISVGKKLVFHLILFFWKRVKDGGCGNDFDCKTRPTTYLFLYINVMNVVYLGRQSNYHIVAISKQNERKY